MFLNFALLGNQLSAELQKIHFDSMEWVPGTIVDQNTSAGWLLSSGNALVSPDNEGYGEVGKSLKIPKDPN